MQIEHGKLSICDRGLCFHWKTEKMLSSAQWFISFHSTIQLQEFHPKEGIQNHGESKVDGILHKIG